MTATTSADELGFLRSVPDDLVQPFQIESSALRGRLVRLGSAVDTILTQHDYPEPVAIMLGEAITLAAILAGALKYEGVFTLQTKGDGPLHLLVADVTSAGALRGYAQFDRDKLDRLIAESGAAALHGSVPKLLGAGYIAFTVDQGEHTERYQGIVELQGGRLADCAHHYFRQSEQIQAGIKLAVGRDPVAGTWRAGGLMLQRLPTESGRHFIDELEEDRWRRAMVLMSSSTVGELLDPCLAPNDLLFRLFHEDGVRVYDAHDLAARCRCSRERIERVLRSLPEEDRTDLAVDGEVRVTCEFCNAQHVFSPEEVAAGLTD
ncbi:MAG: Hsp33 family molecular chaperone [Rhodospirillales bacterium]|nr:Hsp33 family molecular chaperone [Rhodospirillales bacterium]